MKGVDVVFRCQIHLAFNTKFNATAFWAKELTARRLTIMIHDTFNLQRAAAVFAHTARCARFQRVQIERRRTYFLIFFHR